MRFSFKILSFFDADFDPEEFKGLTYSETRFALMGSLPVSDDIDPDDIDAAAEMLYDRAA